MALVTLNKVRTPAHRGLAFECDHWQLDDGQKWAVLGNNGSGKTLFARVLLAQQVIARGEREYAADFSPAKDSQMVSFDRQRELHARDDRFDDSEMRADAYDRGTLVCDYLKSIASESADYEFWVDRLGINALLEQGIRELSTGQMRRVLMAGAALSKARLLLLDDPLAGLDQALQDEFDAILNELFAQLNTALLLTSRVSDVPDSISHLMLIQKGNIALAVNNTAENRQRFVRLLEENHPRVNLPLRRRATGTATTDGIRAAPLIEFRNVSCSFGEKRIFTGLHWVFNPGQHALIAGPNGCGKSTLLCMLTGDNAKAFGQQVCLFGRPKGSGESVWDIRQHFGVVSTALQQQFTRGYTALDVVVSGWQDSIGLSDIKSAAQIRSAEAWLAAVDGADLAQRRFEQLSYGQQRLVLIARAMVKNPEVLILDEPCLGLDEGNRQHVLTLLDAIASETSTQMLFVSHQAVERPGFINQILQFNWSDSDGCYRVEVENLS